MQRSVLVVAVLLLCGLAAISWGVGGRATLAAAALIGGFAGFGLYHASFGFTAAWRRLVREGRGAGVRAQLLLIVATALVTYPLIGWEAQTGWNMHPVILPMTLASALGAAVFGAGMQLGGGCASGTLFTVGGGSTRMVVTLIAFIAGSVAATAHMQEFWLRLDEITGVPGLPAFSVIETFGPLGALAALGGFAALIWAGTVAVERRTHGQVETLGRTESFAQGPWGKGLGALALAAVGIACFLAFQRPWGITSGFALWGAMALEALGVSVRDWGYWSGWRAGQLDAPLLADRVSVMNFGIILGACAAAALAGRFAPVWRISRRDLVTAVIGGLMMGYGARLAFGCNIGAYLGGMVSGSAHGLWWLVWGFAGSWVGIGLRERLGLDPPIGHSAPPPTHA